MELEKNDVLKEAIFTIKFVSFKTPTAQKSALMPERLFFIFKFFTFKNVQTQ